MNPKKIFKNPDRATLLALIDSWKDLRGSLVIRSGNVYLGNADYHSHTTVLSSGLMDCTYSRVARIYCDKKSIEIDVWLDECDQEKVGSLDEFSEKYIELVTKAKNIRRMYKGRIKVFFKLYDMESAEILKEIEA